MEQVLGSRQAPAMELYLDMPKEATIPRNVQIPMFHLPSRIPALDSVVRLRRFE